jgi:uncharacterized membrane protein YgdD (TMEM256/DUF423 family)
MSQIWIVLGSVSGFFSVVLGAFGAHALSEKLSEKSLAIYHTATLYQMFHALALLVVGLWSAQHPNVSTALPGWAFMIGIVLFSGSLYALAVTDIKILGAITPLGGVSFLVGWIAFAILALRNY